MKPVRGGPFGPMQSWVALSALLYPPFLGISLTVFMLNTNWSAPAALALGAILLGSALLLLALVLLRVRSTTEERRTLGQVVLFWGACTLAAGSMGLWLQ